MRASSFWHGNRHTWRKMFDQLYPHVFHFRGDQVSESWILYHDQAATAAFWAEKLQLQRCPSTAVFRRVCSAARSLLVWRKYYRPSESWDHDHYAFCWATITDISDPAPDDRPAAYTDDVSWPASPSLSIPKPCPGPRWHGGSGSAPCPRRSSRCSGGRQAVVRALSRSPAPSTHSSLRHFLAAPGGRICSSRLDSLVGGPGQRIIRRSSRSESGPSSRGATHELEDIWNFEGSGPI